MRPKLAPIMRETVINQAKKWGFICQQTAPDVWIILPQQPKEKWKLELVEDRWLLIVKDIPQIYFHPHEVLAFLDRRRVP
jgi:hypothetical protein